MKKRHPTTQYKRDYKRFRNNPKKLEKIMVILNMLQSVIPIPAEYYPHMFTGNYAGFMECHIEGDFLLIWLTMRQTKLTSCVLVLTQDCLNNNNSFYGGWRHVKLLTSGESRRVHDACISRINDMEVFL